MRKGRSSRRSRVSRPNLGPKTLQQIEMRSGEPSAPHVVIGVTAPATAEALAEPSAAEAKTPMAPGVVESAIVARERVAAPADEREEREDEREERDEPESEERLMAAARESASAMLDALQEIPLRTKAAPVAEVAERAEEPNEEPSNDDSEKIEAKADETSDAKVETATDARDEIAPPPPAAPAPVSVDEESIPPVGDLAVDEKFFSSSDLASAATADDELDEAALDKLKRKRAPEVVQRRARFMRYVTWAVGVSAAVCVVALVRTALTPAAKAPAAAAQAAMIVEPPAAKEAVAPAAPAAEAPKPAETAAPVAEAPKTEPTAAAAAAEPAAKPEGDAKAEKAAAKQALERGKIADAIEAGERAVALDETDGEAWLLLGAAYQEKGKLADARRCYTACVKQAKTGPKHECAAMLR